MRDSEKSKDRQLKSTPLRLLGAALLAASLVVSPLQAQTETADAAVDRQTVRKLQAIKSALDERREQVQLLLQRVAEADRVDQPALRAEIAELQQRIRELSESFEKTAIDGISLRAFAKKGDEVFDWRSEMLQIARPVFDSLKDATAKPRRIAELRAAIDSQNQQLALSDEAIASLARYQQAELPPAVAVGLADLSRAWQARRDEVSLAIRAANSELAFLESEEDRLFENMGSTVYEFILGRGLTLVLALVTGLVVWYLLRSLRRLSRGWRPAGQSETSAARIRLLLYAYHLLSVVLVTLSVLSVFYVRGDVLLLSLAIIALIMLALGVWRFLPGYIQEARLLLNAGAAREGERVVYDGLPFRIASLNLYSELRNPELGGVLRLPLATLAQLSSRPFTSEDWFPTSSGDYVLLPDGNCGQVLEQTVELVRLKVMGSLLQYASADFIQLGARNLSREGFGIALVFGIDYAHQAIALDQVPASFKSSLEQAFADAGFGEDLKSLLVEFKEAGTNSLDYVIYVTLDGRSASSYFAIGRLIQQTCVEVCNREGWGIPFTQITLHQAAPGDGAG